MIVTERQRTGFVTLTGCYPITRKAYLASLDSEGLARFNLSNIYSTRNAVVTGGIAESSGLFLVYAIVDAPFFEETLYETLRKAVDTLYMQFVTGGAKREAADYV